MATKKTSKPTVKSSVKRRTLNQSPGGKTSGDDFNNQDVKRRLGTFEGAGEHARVGGRTSGIVGQTTKKFRTNNRKKSS